VFRIRIQSGQWIRLRIRNFWSSKPWIRIDIQPKMLDKDPDQMNTGPKHWLYCTIAFGMIYFKDPIRRFECIFCVKFAAVVL
jgi:hypothetical protein